ncbi:uncharacterized protein [Centruroides vittatus]|uniref:uncharacterized protein n=1 Tax=Centruroides vittatus TaxID=120091 RepID=UPI00351000BA
MVQTKVQPSKLRIGIDRIRNINGGSIAVEFDRKENSAILEQCVNEQIPELTVRKPRKRWPHMVIYSTSVDICREDLPTLIYRQNGTLTECLTEEEFLQQFRIKFNLGKRESPYRNWVVEVSPDLRKCLLKLAKLNIEWSRSRVADFVPVLQCFKCCQYGHTTKNCPQNNSVCSHCAGEHLFKECPNLESPPAVVTADGKKVMPMSNIMPVTTLALSIKKSKTV